MLTFIKIKLFVTWILSTISVTEDWDEFCWDPAETSSSTCLREASKQLGINCKNVFQPLKIHFSILHIHPKNKTKKSTLKSCRNQTDAPKMFSSSSGRLAFLEIQIYPTKWKAASGACWLCFRSSCNRLKQQLAHETVSSNGPQWTGEGEQKKRHE